MKKEVTSSKLKCAKTDEEVLKKAIEKLPESQQAAVNACFKASKVKSKKGMRYTNPWIYECLLLIIKSRKAYNHIRSHNILAVPSVETLNRYIKVIKGSYGFNDEIFDVLTQKTSEMEPDKVRGGLYNDIFVK